MAYEQNLSRGLQSAINNTPLEDGKLRFAVDTARLFLDLKNERIEISDFIRGLKQQEIKSLKNPLPKMYLSSDTHELLFYHAEEWISFGVSEVDGLGQVIHKTYIKDIRFVDDDMIAVLGDDTTIPVKNSIFPALLERISTLETDLYNLREDHEALVEAVVNWGKFVEIPAEMMTMIGGE